MAEFNKHCDIYQGYNYKKDRQTPVGFITSLKIGDKDLAADQTVKDPLNPEDDLKVVAVLSGALWQLGPTDALYFSGQVSVASKQRCQELLFKSLTKVEVVFQFSVYDYDPIAKKYFKCLTVDADMKGILEKNGDDLNLALAEDKSTEVQSPENYAFQIGIKPQPESQNITVAVADQKNIVKGWGVAVAA
ncbi:MAG: hypothetical protein GX607_15850 [Myxococcales bacterium]|jgi:hypothetical protein|nr:hypothetical protein [Myxococcales bacterium]